MSQLGVGKEILSYCNKCKLPLAHIIVTMKSDKLPHRVQCKTCQTTQVFKDPALQKLKKTTLRTRTTRSKAAVSIENIWINAVEKGTKEHQKYSPKTRFELGDVIDHPNFGAGVIDKLIDNDKIQVIFKNEVKTLIHNK